MKSLVTRFVKDKSGATAIEYGLIAGLVSVVIITVLVTVGDKLTLVFNTIGIELGKVAL
ncbi:pilus assembly protein (plasmid) [Microvirga ossetica]|uniref:Pilus assembly protein n=1 Tax=Microvirga ossetica TaxID=1882682 RepID=A0A1B2ETE7_9HYPH|nr:Flp family type IVb pilin [Microvirga ossetica]ANY83255.1 pilus assembly protein [Microvirga ossetica]